jgi:cytochrome c
VGPQAEAAAADKGPAGMDEFNATRTPGFYGWPMFMGPNVPYNHYDYAAKKAGAFFDKDAPVNDSKYNTGLKLLPPARPAMVAYGKDSLNNPWPGFARGGAVPIAGPVYRYDGKNPSRMKLPPHFEGKWFVADAFQKWIKVIGLDDQVTKAVTVGAAFPGMAFPSTSAYSIVAMAFGPDGALYVSENDANVTYRIEYTGTCLPDVTPAIAIRDAGAGRGGLPRSRDFLLQPGTGPRSVAVGAGLIGFSLFDMGGRMVWEYRRGAAAETAGAEAAGSISVPVPQGIGAETVLRGRMLE